MPIVPPRGTDVDVARADHGAAQAACTPSPLPTRSRSAGRRANSPLATTPGIWLSSLSSFAGSVMSSRCTSRMRLPSSVLNPPATPALLRACELSRHVAACHRDHLDGQWKRTEAVDDLAVVDDAQEALSHLGDDLLSGERAAPAFDQVAVPGGFIGAVDVQRHRVDLVEVEHPHAVRFEPVRARHGARHRPFHARLDASECVDEIVRGGAAAHPDHLAGRNMLDRGPRDRLLLFVLGHRLSAVCRNLALRSCGPLYIAHRGPRFDPNPLAQKLRREDSARSRLRRCP